MGTEETKDCPSLRRDLEPIPVMREGQQAVALRDPQELSPGTLILGRQEAFFVALMDGERTVLDLQEAFMRRFGELVFSESIQRLIEQLDRQFLLENDRYLERMSEEIKRFQQADVRRSSLAGLSYDADPGKLKDTLNSYFVDGGEGDANEDEETQGGDLLGIVAPHIDLGRGGVCYARAHKVLAEEASSESVFLILGTAHMPGERPVILTRKDFETPLGKLPTDKDLVDELLDLLPFDALEDEYLHRREHSVEFQVLFLQNGFPKEEPKILPVLVGPFDEDHTGTSRTVGELEAFVEVLQQVMRKGKRLVLIASADLSHLGPRFGNERALNAAELAQVEVMDRAMLGTVASGEASLFRQDMLSSHQERNVCGYPSIYCLLSLLSEVQFRGDLLDYKQCVDPQTGDMVSIASMAFRAA